MNDILNKILAGIDWWESTSKELIEVDWRVNMQGNLCLIFRFITSEGKKDSLTCALAVLKDTRTLTFFYEKWTKVYMDVKNLEVIRGDELDLKNFSLSYAGGDGLGFPYFFANHSCYPLIFKPYKIVKMSYRNRKYIIKDIETNTWLSDYNGSTTRKLNKAMKFTDEFSARQLAHGVMNRILKVEEVYFNLIFKPYKYRVT